MRKRRHISVSLIILLIFTVLSLFPVYWTVTTAFKKPSQIMVLPPDFIPTSGTPDNFKEAFSEKHIGTFFGNSLLIAVATSLMTLLLASLAGYGYSRFRFKGRKSAMMLVIIVRMIPALIYMVPYYIIFNNLGMLDSKLALTVVYITANLPLAIWLATGFFDEIPAEVFESAKIDGCSEFQVYRKIALPLVIPGLVVISILVFLASYNEFGTALVLLFNDANKTLPVGISGMLQLQKDTPYGLLAAAGTIALIPAFILALTTQKYVQKGITAGAVKG